MFTVVVGAAGAASARVMWGVVASVIVGGALAGVLAEQSSTWLQGASASVNVGVVASGEYA